MSAALNRNIRFGPFELDVRSGELRKGGVKVRLPDQPFQILLMLLERPGDLISRDEIRTKLWPGNTVVEFDHSINAAVKRLRNALCDSAEKPRYVETLARRGYRFIGEVERGDYSTPAEPAALIVPAEPVAFSSGNGRTVGGAEPSPSPPAWLRPRILIPIVLAATVLILWAGAGYYRRGTQPLAASLQPLMRMDLDLGIDASPSSERGANAILSPDGTRLVYVSHSKLFTRRLDQVEAMELPGTEGADLPFFSPDGQWVGFFAGSRLNKISIQKKQVIPLGDGSLHNGASWGEDGAIIAGFYFRLARIPSGGGSPTFVTELAPGEIVHRWPQILPGGKAVLFSAYRSLAGLDGATIEVVSLKDGSRKTVMPGAAWGRYLPSGHLVYINQGTLFAVPFDPDRLEVRGASTPVLDNVAYSAAKGFAEIDFSRTGALVYQSRKAGSGLVTIQQLDESGNVRSLIPVPGNYLSPTLSPDGSRLALTSAGDIWVYELGRGRMTPLTFGGGYTNPLWTADGRYLLFRALSQSARGIWWIRADGMGQPQPLTRSNNPQLPWSLPTDGKRLAFNEVSPATGDDIWTVPLETDSAGVRAGTPELFLQSPLQERSPTFSPDGRWMAYMTNESGRFRVYVRAFRDGHGKRQVSTETGTYPSWSRNGHDLFFMSDGLLMAASYKVRGDSFVAEKPRVWFKKRIANFSATMSYDPAPDGKHVVALMPADTSEEPRDRAIFLLNFFDELRRRAPFNAN